MEGSRKIVLVSTRGYRSELDAMVFGWMAEGVKYIGVIGVDASGLEDVIDELCVGSGAEPYFMLTTSHSGDETIEDAVFLATQVTGVAGEGPVEVIEF